MKKICMLVAVAIALVAGFACTQEETEVKISKTEQAAFDELRMQIAALNAEFGVTDVKTRGLWDKIRSIWKVAKADAIGAVVGNIVASTLELGTGWGIAIAVCNGVDASVNAAKEEFKKTEGEKKYVPERTTDALDDLFEEGVVPSKLDSVGFYHNHIICDLYDTFGDELYTMDKADYEGLIVQYARQYLNCSESFTGVPESEELNTLNQIVLDMDEDNMDASFEAIALLLPNCVEELQVVENYCRTLATFETDEELVMYTKAHNNILLESTISEYSKELIRLGILVGYDSSQLWEPREMSGSLPNPTIPPMFP